MQKTNRFFFAVARHCVIRLKQKCFRINKTNKTNKQTQNCKKIDRYERKFFSESSFLPMCSASCILETISVSQFRLRFGSLRFDFTFFLSQMINHIWIQFNTELSCNKKTHIVTNEMIWRRAKPLFIWIWVK